MTIIPEQQVHENKDERWNMIGRLVETYGTENDKNAWMLCRGDAAEWHIQCQGGISSIIRKLKTIKKNSRTARIERAIVGIFFVAVIVASYIIFR